MKIMFGMSGRSVEQRTEEIYNQPKNRFLRFLRRGGSREDASFVAGTQFLVEFKNALGQGDARSRAFAARIKKAASVKDIQKAIVSVMEDQGKKS